MNHASKIMPNADRVSAKHGFPFNLPAGVLVSMATLFLGAFSDFYARLKRSLEERASG